ncbi:hypothetical protein AUJ93_03630 [bacterium CG2_30_33_46]|nr:MAG: hypothetical protein AUJ93_03630 [bacterium CG2_30_33_46]
MLVNVKLYSMSKDFKVTEVINWQIVEDCLAEKTASGYKMALIEADKLIDNALIKAGYPGKDIIERINSAKSKFSNIKNFKKAREHRSLVLNELSYNLNSIEVEEAVKFYHQAFIDIEGNPEAKLNFFERILALVTYYIPSKSGLIKNIFIYTIVSIFIILFLADSKLGQSITKGIVDFTHFMVIRVLVLILVIIAIVTIITLSILYFEKRKKQTKEFDL